jgi:hypothetical protein
MTEVCGGMRFGEFWPYVAFCRSSRACKTSSVLAFRDSVRYAMRDCFQHRRVVCGLVGRSWPTKKRRMASDQAGGHRRGSIGGEPYCPLKWTRC